jgi:hypothetical protein
MTGPREQLREEDRQNHVARGFGVTAGSGAQREREKAVEAAWREARGAAAPGAGGRRRRSAAGHGAGGRGAGVGGVRGAGG